MKRTNVGLNIQASYGIDPERSESFAEELAKAWGRGHRGCACGPPARCRNPYEPHADDCTCADCYTAAMGGGK